MARALAVELVGDSRSLERAFSRSARSAKHFNTEISRLGRGGVAASGMFRGLGRSVAFASGAFLGGFGLVTAVRSAFEEMSQAQSVAAQTSAAIKSTGGVAGVSAKHVEELGLQLMNLSGANDEVIKSGENVLLTFTNIRNVAGKNNDVFDQATVAVLNLATRLHKQVPQAALVVGKALQDPIRGMTSLTRVGVLLTAQQKDQIKTFVASGHVLEAQQIILDQLTTKFGGAAAAAGNTFAGKLNIAKENLLNLGGAIAGVLLPSLTHLVDRTVAWLQNTKNQKDVVDKVTGAVRTLGSVLSTTVDVGSSIAKAVGGWKSAITLLVGLWAGFKIAGVSSALAVEFANVQAAAGTAAAWRAALISTGWGALAVGAGIAAAEIIAHWDKVKKYFELFWIELQRSGLRTFQRIVEPFSHLPMHAGQWARDLKESVKSDIRDLDEAANRLFQSDPRAPAGIRGPISAKDVDKMKGADRPGSGTTTTPGLTAKEKAALRRRANAAQRQAIIDRLAFAVNKAGLTKTLTDDLAALRKLQAVLRKRIAGGHDTLDLEKQLLGVQQQIADVAKQQAEQRKAARDARQFKILGLGPTGEALVPGVKSLKRELGSVEGLVSGTFLDTKKTRSMLNRIRQVLKAGIHGVSSEVRAAIRQMLDDLENQIKNKSVDQTKFHKVAPGILGALGLNEKQRKVLSRILPQLGPGGVLPTASGQFAAGGVPIVIQIDGKTVAKVTAKHNENALGHRKKGRAHSRRGTR